MRIMSPMNTHVLLLWIISSKPTHHQKVQKNGIIKKYKKLKKDKKNYEKNIRSDPYE